MSVEPVFGGTALCVHGQLAAACSVSGPCRVAQLEGELAEMRRKYKFTYCAYCGQEFEIDAPNCAGAVGQHIRTCEKHPMRRVEAERDEARQELDSITSLLRQRFPATEQGLPDFKIEDVFRERDEARAVLRENRYRFVGYHDECGCLFCRRVRMAAAMKAVL